MDLWKKRYPCETGSEVECNTIEARVFYDKGGQGWNGNMVRRGYYLSVSPLNIKGCMVSYSGWSGVKKLLVEVKRQSLKAEKQAVSMALTEQGSLIKYVCEKNGIPLPDMS